MKRSKGYYPKGRRNIRSDKKRTAKPVGKRITVVRGKRKVYYEYRLNHADKSRKKRL